MVWPSFWPDVFMMQMIIKYTQLLLYDMFTIFKEVEGIWIAI